MLKFSVIIPIYNVEKYLDKCVQSILDQTYENLELILVNDGSTDKSEEICLRYAARDERIRYISSENRGAGPARNLGIEASSGDYLVFCDGDDFYEKTALQSFADAAFDEPDLIISSYREFKQTDSGDICFGLENLLQNKHLTEVTEIRGWYADYFPKGFTPWAKAYRRATVVENTIYFPNLLRWQDGIFNLYYFEYVRHLKIISKTTYNYRTECASRTPALRKMPSSMFDIIKCYFETHTRKLTEWGKLSGKINEYLITRFVRETGVALRLNYQNRWNLSKQERKDLSIRMLNDDLVREATKIRVKGVKNNIVRSVLKSRNLCIVNMFSCAVTIYERLRGRI